MPTVLVLGATSTIARAVARELAGAGYDVVLGGRDAEELAILAADLRVRYAVSAETVELDALRYDTHAGVLEGVVARSGAALEGVVLAFGYLGEQALAEKSLEESRLVLETNYLACVSCLEILAPHFAERRSGFLCVLSSVAGDRGRQSNYVYGAAKAALTTYLQGLRNRMFPLGVAVITIKPGVVATKMTFGGARLPLIAEPGVVAKGIVRAIARRSDVVYVPWFWRWIMLAIRLLPERVFKRLRL